MVKIVQKEAPILRDKAKEVPEKEIGGAKINKIISKMRKALEEQEDGVAIAAPQIGENLKIFVISKRAFEIIGEEKNKKLRGEVVVQADPKYEDMIFINPKLLKTSKERQAMEEGCLSVRYLYGKVNRAKKATIQATNEKGEKILVGGSGLIAQIFQHEMDHLEGVLFTDKAIDLEEILPKKLT